MSKNVLLSNANFIKNTTNIDTNVSEHYIFAALNEAQEIDLKGIIGDTLLAKIKDLVSDGTINNTENAVYKDLLQQCQFFLAYDVVSKLCVKLSYKISNVGVYHSNDENVFYADFKEVLAMQEVYENSRDFFRLEIVNFCLNHRANLPELNDCACRKIRAQLYSAESCPIVLGGARSRIINKYYEYYKG